MNLMKRVLLVIGILISIFCTNITRAQTTIGQMLENMTTEQKIAQMLMLEFRDYNGENVTSTNPKMEEIIRKYGFAGVILFGENNESTEQTVKLIDSIQKTNATVEGRSQMLIAVDQEGATVSRLASGTQGPGNMGLGATSDESKANEIGEIIGSELSKIGYNVDFAPVVDVNSNPSNPVINVRSFSDDAEIVSKFANNYMNGLKKQNIIASLKHFPGHGDTAVDSHTGLPRIEKTYDELKENELIPFENCINNGAEMIMTAHIQYPKIESGEYISIKDGESIELPATLSKRIITDILRKDLKFNGVVVTDAMNMKAISEHFDALDAAKLIINAGVDIILMPVNLSNDAGIDALEKYITDVAKMVDDGKISIDNVNEAVRRILTLKENHGLLTQYSCDNLQEKIDIAVKTAGSKTNHDKEWEIAKQSITLVKNNDMLPIRENEKTVVVVQYSNEILSAEYAIDLLKADKKIDEDMDITVFLMYKKDISEIKEAIQGAKNVIVITEQGSASALAGDTYKKFDEIIEYVHSSGNKIAFISCKQPYDSARLQESDAIFLAYSCKGMNNKPDFSNSSVPTYGVSIPAGIYMAFGEDIEVTGKLPVNIPCLDENNKYTDEYLYKRGYGLNYEIDPSDIYLRTRDFDILKGLIDSGEYGNQSGIKSNLAFDVIVEKEQNYIYMGESGENTDSSYKSILSAIEVMYGKKAVEYFETIYPGFDEGTCILDGFSIYLDYEVDLEESPIFSENNVVEVIIDNEYMKDVFLRDRYNGEIIDSGDKVLEIDFTSNSYKFGFFDSIKDGGDGAFLFKYILEPVYIESGIKTSGDTIYFNVVDEKIVVGDENNSVLKIVIGSDYIEIVPTKMDTRKTTVVAKHEDVKVPEYDSCVYGHAHVRYFNYDVTANITYGNVTKTSSGGRSSSRSSTKTNTDVKQTNLPNIINVDEWAKEEITKAQEKNLIPETFDKKDATKAISRVDFAAVAVKLYEVISGNKAEPVEKNPFVDTNDEYALKAYALGITKGTSETTFSPNELTTREQMATMLTRALNKARINVNIDLDKVSKFADDNEMHDWGRNAIYFMATNDIIKGIGDNKFGTLSNATVEQSLAIALRSVNVFAK